MPIDSPDSGETAPVVPQFVGTTISSLCAIYPRPLLMTGIFREVLINHFSRANNIETAKLRQYLWQDGDGTGIVIEASYRWLPTLTEFRPAIMIKRNKYQNVRMGIADRLQGAPIGVGAVDAWYYNTFWTGSHTLWCIGRSGSQVELLSNEVARELYQFGDLIRRSFNLMKFRVLEVGEVGILEESNQNFAVPVTVGYSYQDVWKVRAEGLPLRTMGLSTLLDC